MGTSTNNLNEAIKPLNDREREKLRKSLKEIDALRTSILKRRGGKLFSPSWTIIREARNSK